MTGAAGQRVGLDNRGQGTSLNFRRSEVCTSSRLDWVLKMLRSDFQCSRVEFCEYVGSQHSLPRGCDPVGSLCEEAE